ncbi:hypothetical protein [Curtobacterium sp. 9128]|uniref:hypothetical protein n=1 Tax=Curtobacterium sp. 9128 TaxID=1793722 RepID=UPI0011A94377|nr:hypothetical protein [Curtobacterium sp. 9128]
MKLEPADEDVIRLDVHVPEAPIWYGGALEWEDTRLSDDLRRLVEEYARHPERVMTGERAAERLALEVGSPFVVDLINANGRRRRRFASSEVGTNEDSARAFRQMRAEELALPEEAAEFRRAHPDADWYIGPHH